MSNEQQFSIGDVVVDREGDTDNRAIVVNIPPVQASEWMAYRNTSVADDNPDYPEDSEIVVVAFREDLEEHAEQYLEPDEPVILDELNDLGIGNYAFPIDRLRHAEDTDSTSTTDDEDLSEAQSDTATGSETDEEAELDTTSETETTDSNSPSDPETTSETDTDRAADIDRDAESTPSDDDEQASPELGDSEGVNASNEPEEPEEPPEEQLGPELRQLFEHLHENSIDPEIKEDTLIVTKLGQRYQITADRSIDGEGPHRDQLEELVADAPAPN